MLLHQESTPASAISYNPILMAPPTDYKSIFTTLMRNKEIVDDLGHKHLPIFFDMGLLTKALEITWAKPEDLAGAYPCEGGMHLFMAVTAAIGHLYGSTGLSNLLYDSDVFAAGTAQQILSGRDFERGLYAMKLLDEVVNSLLLDEFGHWCRDRDIAVPPELMRGLQELQQEYNCTSPDSVCATKLVDKLTKAVDEHFCPLLDEFRIEGFVACENVPCLNQERRLEDISVLKGNVLAPSLCWESHNICQIHACALDVDEQTTKRSAGKLHTERLHCQTVRWKIQWSVDRLCFRNYTEQSSQRFWRYNWSDTQRPSTCKMVFRSPNNSTILHRIP